VADIPDPNRLQVDYDFVVFVGSHLWPRIIIGKRYSSPKERCDDETSIRTWLSSRQTRHSAVHQDRPALNQALAHPRDLPYFVQQSPVAMRYLLDALDWDRFPERELDKPRPRLSVLNVPICGIVRRSQIETRSSMCLSTYAPCITCARKKPNVAQNTYYIQLSGYSSS
jgi:hypothetical protein